MSLTSYRAAPPRVKPLRRLSKTGPEAKAGQRLMAPIDPVQRLPEKATRAKAIGCERYVSTPPCFGKAKGAGFEDFVTAKIDGFELAKPGHRGTALASKRPQKRSLTKSLQAGQNKTMGDSA